MIKNIDKVMDGHGFSVEAVPPAPQRGGRKKGSYRTKIKVLLYRFTYQRGKRRIVFSSMERVVRAKWNSPLFHGLALQAIGSTMAKGKLWMFGGYVRLADRKGFRILIKETSNVSGN